MRFPAVKNCKNLLRFDKVTADYKEVPFPPDTVSTTSRDDYAFIPTQWRRSTSMDVVKIMASPHPI